MSDFLRFFDEIKKTRKMKAEIYYSSVTDWCIDVFRCDKQSGEYLHIVGIQDCDMELCFAKAQVALKEWLSEHEGGY